MVIIVLVSSPQSTVRASSPLRRETLPLSLEQAYAGIDYGKKGEDFTVAVPRYRLVGKVTVLQRFWRMYGPL